jgi:hypothetical protein
MDINSQRIQNLSNKSFSEVLRDGFKLFFQSYGTLILPLAFFQILLILLDVLILTDFRLYIDSLGITVDIILENLMDSAPLSPSELNLLSTFLLLSMVLFFLQNLIGAIIITIAMCSVSTYAFKKYMKEEISIGESFKSAFNKKIFFAILIIGILLPVSSLLLFFPAVIIFGLYIFIVFTYNMDNPKNSVSEARDIARRSFWRIIGVFIINVTIIFILSYFFNLFANMVLDTDSAAFMASFEHWHNPATRNYGMIILYNILFSVVDILLAPLFICLLTVLFASLKAKKDLKYLYQTENYPSRRFYQESYLPIQESKKEEFISHEVKVGNRFYCPFCGTLIRSAKKFCSKCGENLEFIKNNN